MAGWNYRIVRHRDPLPKYMSLKKNEQFRKDYHPEEFIEWYGIHEVFYNDKGKPKMMTEEPIITSDTFTKSEYNRVLKWMRQAINRPVLDFKTRKEVSDEAIKSCIRSDRERGKTALLRQKERVSNGINKNRRKL